MRYARGVHADAVHGVSLVHRRAVVGDDNELYPSSEHSQQIREALNVGFVQRRVDLIEHAERRRVDLQQAEQQRDDGERAFTTAQRQQPLQLLARRPGHDVDAAPQQIVGLGEHQARFASAEELGKTLLERRLDGRERLPEPLPHVRFQLRSC